jgi:CRP-like cAMP-binding protein
MQLASALTENRLLAGLPPEVLQQLQPDVELVPLWFEQILVHQNDPVDHVYFPTSGMGSLVVRLQDGDGVEAASMGRTGMIGLPLVIGDGVSPFEVIIQISGEGWRISAAAFLRHYGQSPPLRDRVLRYAGATLAQTARQAACNRRHSVQQRLARWLLQARDLVRRNDLPLTQEFLAIMLGVRRPTVSIEAEHLQTAGLIRYRRGQVAILDAVGLEALACEDYRIIQAENDRLLG